MVISEINKYIFIAVPKTGTTSIQQLLVEQDPSAHKYNIQIQGKEYSFAEHATALDIKRTLGEHYSKFRTFAFIRNPFDRIVSSYFFYKNGHPITAGNKNPWPPRVRRTYAKITPFKVWALTYPYKSNIEHLIDRENNLIVDHIGTFENLSPDLNKIFSKLGLNISTEQLKHTNKSKHSSHLKYFTNKKFKKVIENRISKDLEFYEKYKFNL